MHAGVNIDMEVNNNQGHGHLEGCIWLRINLEENSQFQDFIINSTISYLL